MNRRRHLLSFGLALAGHGLLMLLFWQQASRFVAPTPDVDSSPRLAFEVVQTPPPPPAETDPAEPAEPVAPLAPPEAAEPGATAEPVASEPVASEPVATEPVAPPAPREAKVAEAGPAPAPGDGGAAGGGDDASSDTEAPNLYGPATGPELPDSWMTRVLLGLGPRLADDETERRLAAEDLPTDDERAERIAGAWATVKKRPAEVTENKRVLRKGVAGGYRYVDEETGEPLPEPPEPAASRVPMFGDGGRQASAGFTDEWHKRPPKKAPRDDLVPTEDGGFVYSASGYTARIEPDGAVRFSENLLSVKFGDTSDVSEGLLPFQGQNFTSGTFDATDALMRLAGKDPYVTDKLRFLDETRSLRMEMREEHRLERVEQALVQLRRRLDGTWNNWAKPEEVRRRALFELWDECADDRAGALARGFVETYIRAHLPADSTVAFTAEEIATFNETRRSAVVFAPYAQG